MDSPFLVILLVAFTFTFVFIFVLVGTKIELHQINDEFLSDTILTRRIKEHEEWTLIAGHNNLPINVARYENQRLREFDLTWDLDRHAVWGKVNNSRTDLIRLRNGHVHAQVWVAGVNCSGHPAETVQQLYEQIDTFKRLIEKHSQDLALCRSVEELRHAIDAHRIGSLLAVKGGHSINAKLSLLRSLYALGVRSMSLASEHNCCDWADSSIVDELDNGIAGSRGDLSIWGRLVVWEMNRLGMIVDLSYGSYGVALDVLRYSRAPVIYSNAGAYGVHPHHLNVRDDVLKQLASRAGLVMISFNPTILGGYTIDNVVGMSFEGIR
ncbi:dipeptidase 1-like [Anopheles cruzii]|uniref:dipeptidase 1-like n=1 Tax=Anopheles cruzii TaxID=68878 RepID=UPI0022EC44E8|nr:dipeptidase 1-like [Anopheles cruzii]